MIFSESPWFLPAIVLPGLWLTYRLYFGGGSPLAVRWRRTLALLSAAAWIALAWWIVGPYFKLNPEIYHPPVVILATDESESYAALGAREAARDQAAAARTHYESLGFTVRAVGFFGEPTGTLRAFDSAPPPNVQAVLLWTDGRFGPGDRGTETARPFETAPAPVYALLAPSQEEPQGERVTIDLRTMKTEGERAPAADGGEVAVEWRGATRARLEIGLRSAAGASIVWSQALARPRGGVEGAETGSLVTQTFALAPTLSRRIRAEQAKGGAGPSWFAVVRAETGNKFVTNDTLDIQFLGLGSRREVFLRPLGSLDERGLLDALSSDTSETVVLFPGEVRTLGSDLLWTRGPSRLAPSYQGPRIEYLLPETGGSASDRRQIFGAEARVTWAPEGSAFLPLEVLRLADLGVSGDGLRLPAADSSRQALAWAEQDGRRGLLLWKTRSRTQGARPFGAALPPLWRSTFAADAKPDTRSVQARWFQGASAWVRHSHAFDSATRTAPPVRAKPLEELSRLGADEEFLERHATSTGGHIIKNVTTNKTWPTLPGGQLRESRYRALNLAPAWPSLLVIVVLLCALWALRKRQQVD